MSAAPTSAQQSPWIIDEQALAFTPRPDAQALWGVHAQAGYRIEVPDNWNGKLVLYAHGYRAPSNRNLTVTNPSIRNHLIDQGYAWAASSYRANGYVPGTGALDTHRLIGLFRSQVGKPERVYIMGHSLGGHVTGVAIEQWPRAFDGALPLCGVMGDNALFDFFQDAYLVAENLAHGEATVPTPADYYPSGWQATRAQLGPNFPAALNEAGERYKSIVKHLTGGERPIFDEGFTGGSGGAFIFNFGSATTAPVASNIGTVYRWTDGPQVTAEEQAFNDDIERLAANPAYRRPNGLGGMPNSDTVSPPINGTFRIPVLSLHTLGELFVPFSMQQIYAQRAADRGNADRLVIRAIRDTGHCGFSLQEQTRAFDDLVRWVEQGIKPDGDVVLDPAVVADPNYGCQFTTPQRPALPACT